MIFEDKTLMIEKLAHIVATIIAIPLFHNLSITMEVMILMAIQLMLFEILIIIEIIIHATIIEATAMCDLMNHAINKLYEENVMHVIVSIVMLRIFNF